MMVVPLGHILLCPVFASGIHHKGDFDVTHPVSFKVLLEVTHNWQKE